MEINKESIHRFLEGSSKTFIVPAYQREYTWRMKNCKKLWEDMDGLHKNQDNYFLGAVVTIFSQQNTWVVVDGQQRLITISLLLRALQNFLKNQSKTSTEEQRLNNRLSAYLIDEHETGDDHIRLKPNGADKVYFNQLFLDSPELKGNSNIITNYKFFYGKIEEGKISPEKIFDSFIKLEIAHVELEANKDKPQLIFESLNSTGVNLTDGDLIRNYVLMNLSPTEQKRLHHNFWLKIESSVGNNTAEFIRHFLIFKLGKPVKQKGHDVYQEFKIYSEKINDVKKLLNELLTYARIYSTFIGLSSHNNKEIDLKLQHLSKLSSTVSYPFLLKLFDLYENKAIDAETVAKTIGLIESYIFRTVLIDAPTTSFNKFFTALGGEMEKVEKKLSAKDLQKGFFDIISFIIKQGSAATKFPTDGELLDSLKTREIYKLRKNLYFLMERLEFHNSDYELDLTDLTIEHIMPQKLTKDWRRDLGDEYKKIHQNHLHTLGNLTWTANNPKMSNSSFQKKKEIDFNKSQSRLSQELAELDVWDEDALINRSDKLAKEVKEIWPYPETTIDESDIKKEIVYHILEEDLDLTGTKPKNILIKDIPTGVDKWKEVKQVLCQYFMDESPTEFIDMTQHSQLQKHFASKESDLRAPVKLISDLYADTHGGVVALIKFALDLCEYFDFDPSDISFEVR